MKRLPYKGNKLLKFETIHELNPPLSTSFYELNDWANSEEAAIILRKFKKKDGKPSIGAIHMMIYRGQLTAHRFFGRLLFRRTELLRLIARSPTTATSGE